MQFTTLKDAFFDVIFIPLFHFFPLNLYLLFVSPAAIPPPPPFDLSILHNIYPCISTMGLPDTTKQTLVLTVYFHKCHCSSCSPTCNLCISKQGQTVHRSDTIGDRQRGRGSGKQEVTHREGKRER